MTGKRLRPPRHDGWRALPALVCAVLAVLAVPASAAPCGGTARQFAAGEATLAYRDCGRGDVVIVVPGGPGLDASYIVGLADMIARDGHRAVLFEPRGTGASRAAIGDGSRLTVAGSVADLEALRVAIGAERVTILGHSFGGAVAQAYAMAHPERIARLVLLDSVGPDMRPPPTPRDNWRARLTAAERATFDKARAEGDRRQAMRIKFLGSFYHRDRGTRFLASLSDAEIHLDLAPLADAFAKTYAVRAPTQAFPVAIVAGDIDWIRDAEPALQVVYPQATHDLIAHAGHFPWLDAPDAAQRTLHRVLARR